MKRSTPSGFTLVELLASMSILVVLMAIMTQTVGMVGASWRSGKARIDAYSQARTSLSSLDRDLQRIVLRSDLGAFANEDGTAGALAFYTRTRGREGARSASLVDYRVDQPTAAPRLLRYDYGMDFGELDTPRVLTFGKTDTLPDLGNDNIQSLELAPGIVRLDWRFIDGTGAEHDRFVFDYASPNATTNTRIIRVSLLVLDDLSHSALIKSGQLSALLTSTGGTPKPGETLGEYWESLIASSALPGGIPKPVLKALGVFERTLTIPVNQ